MNIVIKKPNCISEDNANYTQKLGTNLMSSYKTAESTDNEKIINAVLSQNAHDSILEFVNNINISDNEIKCISEDKTVCQYLNLIDGKLDSIENFLFVAKKYADIKNKLLEKINMIILDLSQNCDSPKKKRRIDRMMNI